MESAVPSAFLLAKTIIGDNGLATPDMRWLNDIDHHHQRLEDALMHAQPLSSSWSVWELSNGVYTRIPRI